MMGLLQRKKVTGVRPQWGNKCEIFKNDSDAGARPILLATFDTAGGWALEVEAIKALGIEPAGLMQELRSSN